MPKTPRPPKTPHLPKASPSPKPSRLLKISFLVRDDTSFSEGKQAADTDALAEIIDTAFLLSMDNRLSDREQDQLADNAVALRIRLIALLSKEFDTGTAELNTANATLKTVNKKLKAAQAEIEEVADTIEQMGALVKQLDTLLNIVVGIL